jgi:hypothetical protein
LIAGARGAAGAAGLAAAGAGPAAISTWAKAGGIANIVATATMVIVRIVDAPGMRRAGAAIKSTGLIKRLGRLTRTKWVGGGPSSDFRKSSLRELHSD